MMNAVGHDMSCYAILYYTMLHEQASRLSGSVAAKIFVSHRTSCLLPCVVYLLSIVDSLCHWYLLVLGWLFLPATGRPRRGAWFGTVLMGESNRTGSFPR